MKTQSMKNDEEETPKSNEPNSHEKAVVRSDRTYWLAVGIACLVFCIQMLLCMYLLFGPNFWLEFF